MNKRVKDVLIWQGVGLALYVGMRLFGEEMHPKVLMGFAYFSVAAFAVALVSAVIFAWESSR